MNGTICTGIIMDMRLMLGCYYTSKRWELNSKKYAQVGTIRKLKSVYGNQVRAAPLANLYHLAIIDDKGNAPSFLLIHGIPSSFSGFMTESKNQMVQKWTTSKSIFQLN